MKITNEQLKGNWAEQFIAAELSSQGCIIRHVTQGHDTGIDLYCEMVKDGIPHLHFWVQVKCSNRWKGKKQNISYNPSQKHLEYWENQPVPVLLFLVPEAIKDNKKDDIGYYICNYESGYRTSYYKINCKDELNDFLNNSLPYESFLWDLKNGKISYLKYKATNEYKKIIPLGISLKYEDKLLNSILCTIDNLCIDFLLDKNIKRSELYLRPLEYIILQTNDKHYQFYETIGNFYEKMLDYKNSLKYYEISLSLLKEDPNKVWNYEIKKLEVNIDRVKNEIIKQNN